MNTKIKEENEFYEKIYNELTLEEKINIKDSLQNKSCISCTNETCRIESYEKIGYNEQGQPEGSKCFGWQNSTLVGKSKVLKITDINKLKH